MSLLINRSIKFPGVLVLSVGGSLDANTSFRLEEEVNDALQDATRGLIFDFELLEFISSAGIRIVLRTQKEIQQKGGLFMMVNLQPQIRKIFDIIKALPNLVVFASIEELEDYLAEMQKSSLL